MNLEKIGVLWPEDESFCLERQDTGEEYIFLHFISPARIYLHGEIAPVTPGSCILYPKYAYQRLEAVEGGLLHDWFHLTGDLDALTKKYGIVYGEIYVSGESEEITGMMQKIQLEHSVNKEYAKEYTQLLIEELLLTVSRTSKRRQEYLTIPSETVNLFGKLRQKMYQTYQGDWTVGKMAAEVSLSPSRFHKLYKDIFRITPNADLNKIRIEHAKILLVQTNSMVWQIAEMIGYSNPYHFIRKFKEWTGRTPQSYRIHKTAGGRVYHPEKYC